MVKLEKYNDLIAWRKAMDLVERLYRASAEFPKSELYGLTSQIRRAAVSIPSNIAEGQCRSTTGAFLQHLSIAQGSVGEVETQLMIAVRLKYLTQEDGSQLLESTAEVGKLIRGLCASLERKIAPQAKLVTSH
jgi:four helix bundle protein